MSARHGYHQVLLGSLGVWPTLTQGGLGSAQECRCLSVEKQLKSKKRKSVYVATSAFKIYTRIFQNDAT